MIKHFDPSRHYFGTHSGECVSYLDTQSASLLFEDIALSLSRQRRGLGHDTMTIAQHGVITAFLTLDLPDTVDLDQKLHLTLHALLHDAAETYTGDIPMPMKTTLRYLWRKSMMDVAAPIHRNVIATMDDPLTIIEKNIEKAIFHGYGIDPLSEEEKSWLKTCDQQSIALEMRDVMSPERRKTFLESGYTFLEPRSDIQIQVFNEQQAYSNYTLAFREIVRDWFSLQAMYPLNLDKTKRGVRALAGLRTPSV